MFGTLACTHLRTKPKVLATAFLPRDRTFETWLLGSYVSVLHRNLSGLNTSKGKFPNTRSRVASSECPVGLSLLMHQHG